MLSLWEKKAKRTKRAKSQTDMWLGLFGSMACGFMATGCLAVLPSLIRLAGSPSTASGQPVPVATAADGDEEDASSDGTKRKPFTRFDYRQSKEAIVAYDLIAEGMANLETNIDISDARVSKDLLPDIYHSILDEDPRIWYARGTCEFVADYDGTVMEIHPAYMTDDWGQIKSMRKEYEAVMADVLSAVPSDADDISKVRIVHDRILEICSYNMECRNDPNGYGSSLEDNPYGAYAALVQGHAVCRGYSLAFKDACQRLGIRCEVARTQAHEWNKVKLDGSWYNIDLTFDDTGGFARNRYSLFLKSDAYLADYDRRNTDSAPHADAVPSGMECTDTTHDNTDPAFAYLQVIGRMGRASI